MDDDNPHAAYDNLPRVLVVMEKRRPNGASTGWHTHPRGQLLYATEGVMIAHTDAGSWVVPPNRALWMRAGLRHTVSMYGDVLMRTAYIKESAMPESLGECCVIHVSPLLRELLTAAVHLPLAGELSRRYSNIVELIIDEVKFSSTIPLHLPAPNGGVVKTICDELASTPNSVITLAEWADRLNVGRRTLHRLFLRDTGMTFAKWREQARLLHALQKIAHGDKIIDVALECGYSSQSAFTAMFRKHFNISPTNFFR